MFAFNKQNSPLGSSFDEPVFKNQRYIKSLQQDYLNNGYQSSVHDKLSKADIEKRRRQQELDDYNRKKEQFMNEVQQARIHKAQQRMFLASSYEEMIKNKKMRQQDQKQQELNLQKQMLNKNSWIRDSGSERQINKKKIHFYNHELQRHVKAQEERKNQQKQQQLKMKERIDAEATQILKKEYEEMQKKYEKKNKFQERQNNLLGIQNQGSKTLQISRELSPSYEQELSLKKRQQEMYEKGLNYQFSVEEKRRKKAVSTDFYPGEGYNPITNPIPIAYKNPNVLRAMGKR